MKHIHLAALSVFAVALFAFPQAPAEAATRFGGSDIGERISEHLERVHERLDERRARIDERLASIQERLRERTCERLERLADRGLSVTVPEYCDDDDGDPETPTLTFSAAPASIMEGESSELSWNTEHADSCDASGGWSGGKATSGSMTVSPATTTMYTLSCEGDGGEVSKTVTITVAPEEEPDAPMLSFNASPVTIVAGATSTLSWQSQHADTCDASGGWSGAKATSSMQVVSPATTTTYTLSCEGDGGEVQKSVTVTVTPEEEPEAPTLTFSASPATIALGATSTLSWDSEYADTCEASGGWSGAKATSSTQVVSPATTTSYALTCEGEGGEMSATTTVTVIPPSVAGNMVISEVMANPEGNDDDKEWLELYNGTDETIDLLNWKIRDAGATSTLATTTTELASGTYAVVVTSTTTAEMLSLPTGTLVLLVSNIGGGINNSAEVLWLVDETGAKVDGLSWGGNEDAFAGLAAPGSGNTLSRKDPMMDTDTASDWEELEEPTPGA